MKRWILGVVGLIVIVVIFSNADAAVILQSATRSVDAKLESVAQHVESTEFGHFEESLALRNSYGSVYSTQTSDISPNRIVATAYAKEAITSAWSPLANSLFSVNFSVIDNPQDFSVQVSYYYIGLGRVTLYDLTHSALVFRNPTSPYTLINLPGWQGACAFPLTLPLGDYQLTGSANARAGDEDSYDGTFSIDFEAVPEPSTVILLGMGAFGLLAWVWRRFRS